MHFVKIICGILLFIILLLIIIFISLNEPENNEQFCTIETKSGRIRGKLNRTLFENNRFYSFRGVSFAKPPISTLRFKAPEKVDAWSDTLDAFDFNDDCIQPDFEQNIYIGSEDCLHLNVYVPAKCSEMSPAKIKLPVMVYIYGGGFEFGTARFYGPDFLMDTNVIVVTFNYRVGPFGFLSLNLPEYSGNMGMKDQVLALKWVYENIAQFGGDKNQITLFGHSAGAASVQLHMVSPQSKHLFQRAILMSGSALNPFLPAKTEHSTIIKNLAEDFNHTIRNESNLIGFLNKIDGKMLYKNTNIGIFTDHVGRKGFNRQWSVFIEDQNANNPFLIETPLNIFTNSNYESNLATLFSSSPKEIVLDAEQMHPELIENFDKVFEMDLPLQLSIDFESEVYKNISEKIRQFYFDGKHVTKDKLDMLMTDITFLYGIDLSARIQAVKSKQSTFVSKFSAENDWNLSDRKWKESNFTTKYMAHADQLYYLFRFSADTPDQVYQNLRDENSMQRQLIRDVSNFYANFAKFGNPIPRNELPESKKQESTNLSYYDITNDGITLKVASNRERITFWDNIFDEFKTQWNINFNFSSA